MAYDYYYGSQADQFSFIRIPRSMLTEQTFASLSIPAKVLYGVLLDRMSLSRKNGWFDEQHRVYIIYQIGEIQEDLGFSKKKAMDLLTELETFGLLEKKRRGHGLPNILYVKSFMTNLESRSVQSGTSARNLNDSRSTETATSRGTRLGTLEVPNSSPQEVRISVPLKSNTNINQTDKSHIESYQQSVSGSTVRNDEMRSDPDPAEQAEAYRDIIRENIGYEDLLQAHPDEQVMVDGIVELMLETVLCRNDYILIASSTYPAGMVRSRLLKLRYPHIDYVLFCLRKNTSKISNIRKYLLAALFNSLTTMDSYYRAEVSHDMFSPAS